jgi:hypothetical protein
MSYQRASVSTVHIPAAAAFLLQGPGLARLRKPAGPFSVLWSLTSTLMLLLGLAFAWLVGSQALQRVSSSVSDSHAAGRSSVISGEGMKGWWTMWRGQALHA